MKKPLIILIAFLLLSSCKKENRKSLIQVKSNISETDNDFKEHEIKNFKFPDTVSINTMVEGFIEYDRNFGKTVDSDIKERYIFFHVGTDKDSQNLALEKFNRFPYRLAFEDTVGNGLIKFETVFTKPGLNYLHGVIEDFYNLENTDQAEDSIKVVSKKTIITKAVNVINKES
jgi:hypothetical protein